jgi:ATP-binding cassette subfamily C protein CydD
MATAVFDAQEKPKAAAKAVRKAARRGAPGAALRKAAWLQALAALFWIPQAGLLAYSIGLITNDGGMADVLWPAVFVLFFGAAKNALDALGGRMAFRAARKELTSKRLAATMALSRRSPVDSTRPASGYAASVLGEQAELIVPFLARFQPARLKASAVPLVILICILPISWVAALLLLVVMPLIPVFMALIGWRAQAASEKQLVATGGLNAFLLDRLRGLATIRSLDAVDATARRLRTDAESLRKRTMAVLKIAFLSSAVLELFAALGVAMIAVYVGFSLLGQIHFGTWTGTLGLTQGLFILLLAPAFFEPLRELSAVWHDRAAGEAAAKALNALAEGGITLPGADDRPLTAADLQRFDICLENIGFRHSKEQPLVIKDFNLCIAAGEHVTLLGASGSGKSTLLSLIAGLAPCENGRVIIGGVPLTENAAVLQRKMAWIGQKPHIFAGTIAGNVSLGRTNIATPDVAGALAFAKLDRVAGAYGKRPLGEGGIGLSGGEALRLAIARTACDPDVRIIIADEPTAHLDAATAAAVTDSLLALAKGRTLIVATHDPRLAERMHRTIRIDEEPIREAAE